MNPIDDPRYHYRIWTEMEVHDTSTDTYLHITDSVPYRLFYSFAELRAHIRSHYPTQVAGHVLADIISTLALHHRSTT